jgi:hypothetical protein
VSLIKSSTVPATARAAVMTAAKAPLEMREYPLPEPGPGQVLVRVRACTICKSDLLTWTGARPGPVPAILGHEIVGEIVALGEGRSHDAGDRRLGTGRSHYLDHPRQLWPVLSLPRFAAPHEVSFAQEVWTRLVRGAAALRGRLRGVLPTWSGHEHRAGTRERRRPRAGSSQLRTLDGDGWIRGRRVRRRSERMDPGRGRPRLLRGRSRHASRRTSRDRQRHQA